MNIFLDDERVPEDVTWVTLPKLGPGESWTVVRSVEEFDDALDLCDRTNMKPARVSFDHDLADEHYGNLNCNEGTGQVCATALCQLLADRGWDMPEYSIHTMNPIGKKKIEAIIVNDLPKMREQFKAVRSKPVEPKRSEAFKKIEAGLKDAIGFAEGKPSKAKVTKVVRKKK